MTFSRVVIGLVVVALAVAGYLFYPMVFGPTVPPKSNIADDGAKGKVAALGWIRPMDEIVEVGGDTTRRVSQLLVSEGEMVKKGSVLAYLDNYKEMLASANHAQAQYEGGKAQLETKTGVEQANIAKAETDLRTTEEINPQNIKIQELLVEKLKLEEDLARKEAARAERLFQDRSGSKEDADKKNSDLKVRSNALQSAEADLRKMKINQSLDLKKARETLTAARESLRYAQANIDVNTLAKNVELAKSRLENSIIRAPSDGRIMKIRTRQGETVSSKGIVTLCNISQMSVVAEVYETDILRVGIGQKATITATALRQPLTGRVVFVGSLINRQTVVSLDPAAPTDARVAEVRIRLDDAETASRLVNLQVTSIIDSSDRTSPTPSEGRASP